MTTLFAPRFCYRIMGKETPQYTETIFEGGKFLAKDTYDCIHQSLKFTLSKEMSIPPQYFVCISQDEYEKYHQEVS